MRHAVAIAALLFIAAPSVAQMVGSPGELRHFDVTVRRFDPAHPANRTDFVLPVDSPDAEHAAASTLANATAFSQKLDGDRPRSVAFMVVAISQRP